MPIHPGKETKFEDTKKMLRSVLLGEKEGLLHYKLKRVYKETVYEDLPFKAIGFPSIESMLDAMPDTVRTCMNREGEKVYMGIATEATEHIRKMVSAQKVVKKRSKGKRGMPYKALQSKRPSRNSPGTMNRPWGKPSPIKSLPAAGFTRHDPNTSQRAPVPLPRSSMAHPAYRGGGGGGGGPSRSSLPAHPPAAAAVTKWKPADDWKARRELQVFHGDGAGGRGASSSAAVRNLMGGEERFANFQVEVPNRTVPDGAEVVMFGDKYDLPPRFQQLKNEGKILEPDRSSRHVSKGQSFTRPGDLREKIGRPQSSSSHQPRLSSSRQSQSPSSRQPQSPSSRQPQSPSSRQPQSPSSRQPQSSSSHQPADLRIQIDQRRSATVQTYPSPTKTGAGAGAGALNHRSALTMYCSSLGLPGALTFSTVAVGNGGFVSSVNVRGETFGSGIDPFPTRRDAEAESARAACDCLGITAWAVSKQQPPSSPMRPVSGDTPGCATTLHAARGSGQCTPEIKNRIKEIVRSRSNGLWGSRLAKEYEERYHLQPPKELLSWAITMEDIVKQQPVGTVDRTILYPATVVKLTQSCRSEHVDIKPAVMPKPKTRSRIAVTFYIDPDRIYFQSSDAAADVENITTQLQDIYESRGAPKPLVNGQIGEFCVAKYPSDECWYRGVIRNKTANSYSVFYVDFGNTEEVEAGQVRRILETMCRTPAQALCCSLHNVHPLQIHWLKSINVELDKLLDIPLIMDTIHVEGDCCSVELFPESDPQCSFNDDLVDKGLAAPYPLLPEPDTVLLPDDPEWTVYVSYIKSTTDVKIRLFGPGYSFALEALEKKLVSECVTRLPGRCVPGTVCVARSQDEDEDGTFIANRARILAVNKDKAEIYYLDHGEKDVVSLSSMYLLPAHLNVLAYQAIPCKLSGLEPYENDAAVIKKLSTLTLGACRIAQVEERLECISITLWDTSSDEDININSKVAEVLNTTQFKPQLPQVGSRVEGFVVTIGMDGHIFLLLQGPGLDKLNELLEEMNRIYGSKLHSAPNASLAIQTGDAATTSLFISRPQTGQLVAAVYEDEGGNRSWYRALIQEILPGRKVRVFYVDYGDVVDLPYSSLRAPFKEAEYMERLPYQVIQVQLYGFPPAGKDITPAALTRLEDLLLTNDGEVAVHIEVVSDSCESLAEGDSAHLPLVELYVDVDGVEEEDDGGEQSVLSILIEEGVFETQEVEEEEEEEKVEAEKDSRIVYLRRSPIASLSDSMHECIPQDGEWALVSEVEDSYLDTTADDNTDAATETSGYTSVYTTGYTTGETTTGDTVADTTGDTVADTTGNTVADTTGDTVADTTGDTVADTTGDTVAYTTGDTVADTTGDTVADTTGDTVADTTGYTDRLTAASVTSGSFILNASTANTPSPSTLGDDEASRAKGSSHDALPWSKDSGSGSGSGEDIACGSGRQIDELAHFAADLMEDVYLHENSVTYASDLLRDTSIAAAAATAAAAVDSSQACLAANAHPQPPASPPASSPASPLALQPASPPASPPALQPASPPASPPASQRDTIGAHGDAGCEQAVHNNINNWDQANDEAAAAAAVCSAADVDGALEVCSALPEQPLPNSGDDVYITWIEHPLNFRCIPSSTSAGLVDLMGKMQTFYAANQQVLKAPSATPHNIYAGRFHDLWYRLKLMKYVPGNVLVSVMFVDYGDCSCIAVDDLCHLAPYFRILPSQAIRGKLQGVVPAHGDDWSEECNDRTMELIHEKTVSAWIHGTPDAQGFVAMTLVDAKLKGNAFIHQVLISDGHARKC